MYAPKPEQEFQNSSAHPQGGPLRPTEWSSGLLACSEDPSNCCLTCCCPCITFGQIAEIVDEGSLPCAVSGGIYGALLLFTGCACCFSCLYRTKMRAKFNLPENPCTDILVHCCCDLCALCQEYRELKHRGYHPALGWTGNMQNQQSGMETTTAAPVYPSMAR